MDDTNAKIQVPEHLRDDVDRLASEWQRSLMFKLSEQLQDIGVDALLAIQIEVSVVMTWACRVSMLSARILERRAPDADLWISSCRAEFGRTEAWFAENYKDAPPIEVAIAGDRELLVKDFPVEGEVWRHTKTGKDYMIAGLTFNAVTDKVDVLYRPLYPCEREGFTRQMNGHPKAFISINEDGERRFHQIKRANGEAVQS